MIPAGDGGGGGGAIETRVDGTPAAVETVSSWLTDTLKPASTTLGDSMATQQSKATSAWLGDAGEGFAQQIKTTGAMADDMSTSAATATGLVDRVSAGLTRVKDDMRDAREQASSKGLTVSGTLITLPGSAPADVPDLPAGATPEQAADHETKVAAVDAWNAKVTAFTDIGELVEKARTTWNEVISSEVDSWSDQKQNLVGILTDAMSSGLEAGMSGYYGSKFAQAAKARLADATRLAGMVPEGTGVVAPKTLPANATPLQIAIEEARRTSGVYNPNLANDLLNKADAAKLDADRLNKLGQLADDGRLPGNAARVLKGGGVALAGIGTGYGIYADMQDGESAAQAVVSNGGGLVASIAVGAAIGTAIPVPVVGTVVGALGGAVVGIVASGMIDSLWESGLDSVDDVGQAFVDGGKELVETGKAIGDLAGDVGGSIKDGAKDVFDSIF